MAGPSNLDKSISCNVSRPLELGGTAASPTEPSPCCGRHRSIAHPACMPAGGSDVQNAAGLVLLVVLNAPTGADEPLSVDAVLTTAPLFRYRDVHGSSATARVQLR